VLTVAKKQKEKWSKTNKDGRFDFDSKLGGLCEPFLESGPKIRKCGTEPGV
jgi:hypothetical protein